MNVIELIDARGMRCPWPALRLARAMRGASPGTRIRILADDPRASLELASLAEANAWAMASEENQGEGIFTISC